MRRVKGDKQRKRNAVSTHGEDDETRVRLTTYEDQGSEDSTDLSSNFIYPNRGIGSLRKACFP